MTAYRMPLELRNRSSVARLFAISSDITTRGFHGHLGVVGSSGDRWGLELTWEECDAALIAELRGFFFAKLGIRRHTLDFYVEEDIKEIQLGSDWVGAPLTQGAVAVGATQATIDGITSGALVSGRFFNLGTELKVAADDVTAAGGEITTTFWPPVHNLIADNTSCGGNNPNGEFILVSQPSMTILGGVTDEHHVQDFTVTLEEVI